MSPFSKVTAGAPLQIPARAYNAFVDAAHLARRVDADAAPGSVRRGPNEHLVLVRNDSGADLPRFGVLGISGPVVEPGPDGNESEFKRRAAIIGAAITAGDDYLGRFVVATEPIANGKIGWAVIRGVTPVVLNVIDEEHGHADTFADEQTLRTGFTGAARILWKEAGVGERLGLIEMGPADRDRFAARLISASAIDGRPFGWVYEWEEVRLDADALGASFGEYIRPSGSIAEGWLSSAGDPAKLAFNRYEAHLSVLHEQDGGVEGFVHGEACFVPGVTAGCPPEKAAVPMLHPIPEGVVVELRAERTFQGETRFVFDALNPAVWCEMDVPEGWYG